MDYREFIEKALEKRAKLVETMRGFITKGAEEKRSLSAEESEQYGRMEKEFDEITAEIRRYEEMEKREAILTASSGSSAGLELPKGADGEKRNSAKNDTAEYREAFENFIRRGVVDTRNLVVGTDTKGGFLVPTEFERVLLKRLEELNVMRQICDVRNMGSMTTEIPILSSQGAAAWLGEEEAYTVTDDEFAQKIMKAKKIGRIVKISEELLADAAFDMQGEITESLAGSIAKAEEAAFISGTDTKDPRGFLTDALSVNSVANEAVSYQDIVNLKFGIKAPYRTRAVWLMSDTAAKAITVLTDSTGRPLWQPSLQAGQPDLLLGKPIHYSPYMPEFGGGNKPIAFGDFKYYRVGDRAGLFIQRLNELYAANGQVGFRAMRRVDGRLLIGEAIAALNVTTA